MNDVLALILAGGQGQRLSILSDERAKPAVTFAGKYRIVDFTLSNCVNSNIYRVGVLTQYRPRSLNEHIGTGRAWDLDRQGSGVALLQPYTGRHFGGWYKGTADAVYQNLSYVEENEPKHVLILSGDHVYRMRYDDMIAFHQVKGADVTVGVVEVSLEETSRFGVLVLDEDERAVVFEEKPLHDPPSRLASMGIYVFSPEVLSQVLEEDTRKRNSQHDFGRDVLPSILSRYRVYGYRHKGYWRDVGTVESYWDANAEFLNDPPPLELDSRWEPIRTPTQDRPPLRMGVAAQVRQSILCHGSVVKGAVRRSVLSQGVIVEEGAVVEDSVLFDDVVIKRGARVNRAILDKEAVIGEGAVVGDGDDNTPNADEPQNLNCGITLVGKRAVVPSGVQVGRNCKIMPGASEQDFPPGGSVPSGATIEKGSARLALVVGSSS